MHGEGKDQAATTRDKMLTIFKKLFEPHKAFYVESSDVEAPFPEGKRIVSGIDLQWDDYAL